MAGGTYAAGSATVEDIDGGTQSTKVIIFDLEGHVVCQGKEQLKPMYMPRPGVAEHPDDDLWDSIVAASRKALDRFTEDPASIIGMGLCTIRCCRACLKATGNLASPVQNWMDLRLASPYPFDDPQVRYVTTTSGYITHRFTGEFRDTAANYEGMWPIDKDTWQWSDDPQVLETYKTATRVMVQSDALIDKIIGDQAAGMYVPGIAGPDHASRAVPSSTVALSGDTVSAGSVSLRSWKRASMRFTIGVSSGMNT